MNKIERVMVMGAGPGGIATAAGLARAGYNVGLYNLSELRIAPLIDLGGVEIEGSLGDEFVPIPIITTNLEEAIKDVELILIAVPGYGQKPMFEACLPYLQRGHAVVLLTGSAGSLEMAAILQYGGISFDDVLLGETVVIPWSARMVGEVRVRIRLSSDKAPKKLRTSAFPGRNTPKLIDAIGDMFSLLPKPNVLDPGLNNPNFMIHPAPMLLNYAAIERAEGKLSLMNEGMTEGVLRALDAVDMEKMALQKALGLEVVSIDDFYRETGVGPQAYREKGEPFGLRDQIWRRYITEDVPYGMVLYASLGKMLGVPTPVCNSIITLLSSVEQIDFWAEGRTLESMAITNLTHEELLRYLNTGERP